MENVKANDLKEGDIIKFPNSRHPQKIESIKRSGEPNNERISLYGDGFIWILSPTYVVERVDSE